MLTLLLLLADPPAIQQQAPSPPVVFVQLMPGEARALEGTERDFVVTVDSRPWVHGGYTLYDCVTADDVHRTLWLDRGQRFGMGRLHTVRGRLEVIRHELSVIDGDTFEGFTEYRIVQGHSVAVRNVHNVPTFCAPVAADIGDTRIQ